MNTPPVVSPQEWDAARADMLVKEKELTRARDALAAERRRMPWMAVEKEYAFEGPDGPATLVDLFEGRRQLIVYRFFYDPDVEGLARARLRRVLLPRRPGRAPRAPERARHHARVRLARAAGEHPAHEAGDGLGHALVHAHRRLRLGLRRRRVARHERVHPRRRQGLPHLLHRLPRRRGDGHAPGPTSTSRRSAARRSGRTRPRATRRPRPTSGGTTTTRTTRGTASADVRAERAHHAPDGATSRRRRRRCSTPGPARRSSGAGGTPSTTGRPPRRPSTSASAARCGSSCETRTRTSSTAAAAATPRSIRPTASRSPGSGTTTTPGS